MTEFELLLRSGVSFKHFGDEYLIPLSEAQVFVEVCRESAVPILGVDAFRVFGERRQPDMTFDFVASGWTDGTREAWARSTCEETSRFLRTIAEPELYYVFVVDLPGQPGDG